MRYLLLFFVCLALNLKSFAQLNEPAPSRPKLVVGLVVDQMRWDYLVRYEDRYIDGGFKRLLEEGFSCDNALIPYTPTYTAAGHATVYTGTVPAVHGIIGNNWYSRALGRGVYCTDDSTAKPVGSSSSAGKMSPRNMWSNSVADELRLATNFNSKVVGIALKDRGAILPAGHSANAAYWYDNATGGWITSDYYMKDLPDWMKAFNGKKLPDQYLQQNWNTLHPINTYRQSTADDKPYEGSLPGEDNQFPHLTSDLKKDKYNVFRHMPQANTYTLETAKAAIEGEQLGMRGTTDLLAISFSTPDYIGHTFGPNSIEVEDTYLRLDRDLASFLSYLDSRLGKNNYVVFLSADHAVAHVPGFLKENRMPGGVIDDAPIKQELSDMIKQRFGISNAILTMINYQIYLDYKVIPKTDNRYDSVVNAIIDALIQRPEIANAFDLRNVVNSPLHPTLREMATYGYNQKLSGDIQFTLMPGWFEGGSKGTTHGSWNPYDAHIPMVFFGWNIPKGRTSRETLMIDIAPTIAALLRIQMPNGAVGKPVVEIVNGPKDK